MGFGRPLDLSRKDSGNLESLLLQCNPSQLKVFTADLLGPKPIGQ